MSILPTTTTHDWSAANDVEHINFIRGNAKKFVGTFECSGLLHLICEAIAYPLDEAGCGNGSHVECTLHEDGSVSVGDDGRGTAIVETDDGFATVKPIMTSADVRFFEVEDAELLATGRNRSGMSIVSALSESMTHEIRRNGFLWREVFRNGIPIGPLERIEPTSTTGTLLHFLPDHELFAAAELNDVLITDLDAMYAHETTRITFIDARKATSR